MNIQAGSKKIGYSRYTQIFQNDLHKAQQWFSLKQSLFKSAFIPLPHRDAF